MPVDLIFAPGPDEVYPDGFITTVSVGGVSEPLEGRMRPGHFDGVATVVSKLFGMTMADRGYFGQKDWQQLQVVQRLVRDLNIPVYVVGCETIRDPDGVALSSRNVRLTAAGRLKAPVLYAAITAAADDIRAGQSDRMAIREAAEAIRAAGFDRVEYIELRDAETLMPSDDPERAADAGGGLAGWGAVDRQYPGVGFAGAQGLRRGYLGTENGRPGVCDPRSLSF